MVDTKKALAGSPPLARGTAHNVDADHADTGITPACAGNSESARDGQTAAEDHPRLRGEQKEIQKVHKFWEGSPPLARGTGGLYARFTPAGRITPACAGNSAPLAARDTTTADHPRLRGEQQAALFVYASFGGSPPLARGTVVSYR